MQQRNGYDVDLGLLVTIGLISAILLVEVVVITQAYFYNSQEAQMLVKQIQPPSWELSDILLGQQASLNRYAWVDREKQRVSIPIDLAIQRYVEQEKQRAATRPQQAATQPH